VTCDVLKRKAEEFLQEIRRGNRRGNRRKRCLACVVVVFICHSRENGNLGGDVGS
jgi:hypothetical protein